MTPVKWECLHIPLLRRLNGQYKERNKYYSHFRYNTVKRWEMRTCITLSYIYLFKNKHTSYILQMGLHNNNICVRSSKYLYVILQRVVSIFRFICIYNRWIIEIVICGVVLHIVTFTSEECENKIENKTNQKQIKKYVVKTIKICNGEQRGLSLDRAACEARNATNKEVSLRWLQICGD